MVRTEKGEGGLLGTSTLMVVATESWISFCEAFWLKWVRCLLSGGCWFGTFASNRTPKPRLTQTKALMHHLNDNLLPIIAPLRYTVYLGLSYTAGSEALVVTFKNMNACPTVDAVKVGSSGAAKNRKADNNQTRPTSFLT